MGYPLKERRSRSSLRKTRNFLYDKNLKGGNIVLSEEQYERICQILEDCTAISITELVDLVGASESTIRRDLT